MYLVEMKRSLFETKIKPKGKVMVTFVRVDLGPWRRTDSKTHRIGEIVRHVDWSDNLVVLKGKQPKLRAVINELVDHKVQEFELEEETSIRAVVHFESSRGIFQRFRGEDGQDRSQVFFEGL